MNGNYKVFFGFFERTTQIAFKRMVMNSETIEGSDKNLVAKILNKN